MKPFSLRLFPALAVLTLTQCTWPEPRYDARYEGPATPRAYHRDTIFGDSYFRYPVLRSLAASPLWARLDNFETRDNCTCAAILYDPLPMPATENTGHKASSSGKTCN